jgi:hypothetical protein
MPNRELAQGSASPANVAEQEQPIPPELTIVAPAIFLPLDSDITKPGDLPQDRVQRLERIIKSINFHRQGIRQNLLTMFEGQVRRLQLLAAQRERQHGKSEGRASVSPDEADRLLAAMEKPAVPGVEYNVQNFPPFDVNMMAPAEYSDRDSAAWEVLREVERGMQQLNGLAAHMTRYEALYLERLRREVDRFNAAGQRPEERGKT